MQHPVVSRIFLKDFSFCFRPFIPRSRSSHSHECGCNEAESEDNCCYSVTRVLEEPVIGASAVYLGAVRLPIRVQNQHPVLVFPLNVLEECHTENTVFRIPCP